MCNIAGYVGSRRAAPIIMEMLRREEGFAGGYYSGLATMCEGKIFSDTLDIVLYGIVALAYEVGEQHSCAIASKSAPRTCHIAKTWNEDKVYT